ncbi:hypothetical protein PN36_29900 [Candidatus Thiomargarita nelsonii]|uniref:AAA-ATPase-like domain-containing protein n=1 Tax=Candidatus Thiomargarita nelsonii TaxID=1003181 RepID=A0A0A6PC23_9GAMM|nr:hypothetical protein PN36_29900 [Candidatus Thiomargarita nelsonii]
MLKFPYSVCDFYKLITNNYYYADRTNHIRLIEEAGEQLLFLRPRRFGLEKPYYCPCYKIITT